MKKNINSKPKLVDREKEILDYWTDRNIFKKLKEKIKGGKKWSFIDGPITANNKMGVHHGWGRSYKDLYLRYKAMNGYDLRFQNGFDGQGLWVEVDVEKQLGLNSKQEIEEYGLAKFAKKCRARVEKYSEIISDQSKRLGQWMDWDNSYQTMSDNNIEHIWHFLKVVDEKGLLYQGHTVLPWCPRCGTSLSSHELYDNYQERTHEAVFLKYPLKGEKNTYLLVWTTTPWTLLANVGVAVDPKLDYIKIKKEDNVKLILAKDQEEVLEDNYEIIDEFKGEKIVGKQYEGAFDEFDKTKNVTHKIIGWPEVGAEEGTGLVHIAPGCGEEDFELSKQHELDIIAPIDEEGKYKKGFGAYTDKNSQKINDKIFEDLEKKSLLYKTEKYNHRYPLCWRCDEELVFRLVDEWFLKADPVRERMKEKVKKVNWQPADSGKRMQNWLDNMSDWNISRKRYWGLPLPFYECSCGKLTVIGSKNELKERAITPGSVDKLPELHRPWVDRIKIKCPECGNKVERVEKVGDCWLDAGIVPYSTLNYMNDKKYWQDWFPADFVTEMREQVRLWFYSLLFMSTVLENKTPYLNVLTHSEVLDEEGEEMHKSKGNAIWFEEAVKRVGADVMRHMYLSQNPGQSLRFGYNIANEVKSKFNTWWNSLNFFISYAGIDNWDPEQKASPSHILDKWIMARYHQLAQKVKKELDDLRPDKAVRDFDKFLDDLSNWYIRRSRRRFWKSGQTEDKRSAYSTLYLVLIDSSKLMAPFFPFITERIYQALKVEGMPESVHLTDYPQSGNKLVDKKLLSRMKQTREIVYKALSIRSKKEIKVRQPLSKLVIDKELPVQFQDIIQEEVNVKEIEVGDRLELNAEITPKLKKEGVARELVRHIQSLRKKADYKLSDRIKVYYETDSKLISEAIESFGDYIEKEVLAIGSLSKEEPEVDASKEKEIEGKTIWLGVKSN